MSTPPSSRPSSRTSSVVLAASATVAAAIGVAISVEASPAGASVPRPPQGAVRIVSDTFHRSVSDGLGRADVGGAYAVSASRGTKIGVRSGAVRVAGLARGHAVRALLPHVSARDAFVTVSVTVPTAAVAAAGFYFGTELRVRGQSMYRAKVRVASGRVGLRLARVGSTEQTLAARTLALRVKPGNHLVVQAQVTGATAPTLSARAWLSGHAAPGWQLRATDRSRSALTRAGAIGTWAYESRLGRAAAFSYSGLAGWRLSAGSKVPSAPGPSRSTPVSAPPTPTPPTPTPPTSTPPTSAPPATPPSSDSPDRRGAADLGTTSFPVPDDALYVAPSGTDSAAGTKAAPLRTVSAAVSRASAGQTIVLRGGTYHESLQIPSTKSGVVIESAPYESVWFDGSSVVEGWTPQGANWVRSGWTTEFDHSASFTSGRDDGMAGSQNPMAAWPDGVWVDGTELRQVGAESAVGPGTFYVDYAGDRLVVGTDPVGHQVRASDLAQAIKISASGVTLRGFGVRRYATPLPLIGTVRVDGTRNVLRDLVVTDNATQGVSFRQSGNLVDHLTVTYNGMTGIHANVADALTIRNSVIDGNNAEHFNPAPSAGGAKITRSRHLTVLNNSFDDNGAPGLWFDQCDVYFTVAGNSFQGDYIGAQLELADTGVVANNTFRGGKYGLYVFDTGNVRVYNNSFANHPVGAVLMSQDQRRQADPTAYRRDGDSRYPMGDSTNPWLLRNVVVANNLFPSDGTSGMFQVYALDKRTNVPADDMNLTITGNYFRHRDTSAQPTMVGWGGSDNVTVIRYETPDKLSAEKNPSWSNGQAAAGVLRPSTAQVDDSIAAPLPADIASVVGQPAGARHIGPF